MNDIALVLQSAWWMQMATLIFHSEFSGYECVNIHTYYLLPPRITDSTEPVMSECL